jgi:probable biosynthetic protein (TIGR04098 family)
MLDGEHHLYRAGTLPDELPSEAAAGASACASRSSAGSRRGDASTSLARRADLERIPVSSAEPDSYRVIRQARQNGRFGEASPGARVLWDGAQTLRYPIDADRDVNGVGLVYFANYVAIMDWAERRALVASGGYAPPALDGRRTRRRRIGFYGNALRHDTLDVEVEALLLASDEPTAAAHRIRRQGDGRLIAVSSAERGAARVNALRAAGWAVLYAAIVVGAVIVARRRAVRHQGF